MNRSRVSDLNRERIATLHPVLVLKAGEFLSICEVRLRLVGLVTSALRTFAEQETLFAKGRYGPDALGKKVTWVKPGYSFHNFGLSLDFVPLKEETPGVFRLDWDDEEFLDPAYRDMREIAKQLGFGLLPPDLDRPHLQCTGGWTCAELMGEGYGRIKSLASIPIPMPKRQE